MSRRPEPPEDVYFPVVPMLDMAFQLLAFFILTFQAPTTETRIDLDLPAAPAALPGGSASRDGVGLPAPGDDLGLETDLTVRAEADPGGALRALRLGEAPLPDPDALTDRLRRYRSVLADRPVRITLVADETLRYEEAARLLGACSLAGVGSIRLAPPPGRRQEGRGP